MATNILESDGIEAMSNSEYLLFIVNSVAIDGLILTDVMLLFDESEQTLDFETALNFWHSIGFQ